MFITLSQYSDLGLFLLRLVVGIIFIYHSLPKMKAPDAMAGGIGMSPAVVRALGVAELLAGVGIITGIAFYWAALIAALVMCGAIYYKIAKWHVKFWAMDNTGWEFDLLILAAAIFFLTNHPGNLTF